MTYSVRNIVIALVLAAVAAGLVILYTGNVQKQAHDSQQNVTVVVAKSAIAAGSPVKDLVDTSAFETRQVVQRDVVPGAYTSIAALNKRSRDRRPHHRRLADHSLDVHRGHERADRLADLGHDARRPGRVQPEPGARRNAPRRRPRRRDRRDADAVVARTTATTPTQDASRVLMTNVQVLSTKADGVAATALTADSDTSGGQGSGRRHPGRRDDPRDPAGAAGRDSTSPVRRAASGTPSGPPADPRTPTPSSRRRAASSAPDSALPRSRPTCPSASRRV